MEEILRRVVLFTAKTFTEDIMNNLHPKLMEEILNNAKAIREVLPTHRQLQIIELAKKKEGITSEDLQSLFIISLTGASCQLGALYKLGWLHRRDMGDITGGRRYFYTSVY